MNERSKLNKDKVGIYSPYLDILGGGERYILSIAEYLSKRDEVYLYGHKQDIEKAKRIFNIQLDKVHLCSPLLFKKRNILHKMDTMRTYNLFFYMTDGSLFFPFAQKNILLVQSPIHIPKRSFLNIIKLRKWRMVCNSNFTQSKIQEKLNIKSDIIFPPVDTKALESKASVKKNIILSVGRFFSSLHNKKQQVLIDVFKEYFKKYFLGWRLVIVGGLTEYGGADIVKKLKKESIGYPIEVLSNISFDQLVKLYQEAKIYWHATGFGEDLNKYPEKSEHFGITTVEAMAAGVVPVVFNSGEQAAIVRSGKDGYVWMTEKDLAKKTYSLITNNLLLKKLAKNARLRAQSFSYKKFYENLEKIILE